MKRISKYCFLVFAICFFVKANAQTNPNLVSNPDFESYTQCPIANFNSFFVTNWNQVTFQGGSSDYFNACNNMPNGNGDMGVPNNNLNSNNPAGLNANSGVAYSGLLSRESLNEIEFIYTTVQLTADVKYDVSFYVSLASVSAYATPLSIAFTQNSLITNDPLNNFSNANFRTSPSVIDNSETWQQLTFDITPNSSGIYYLVIGNFSTSNAALSTTGCFACSDFAYYYIDDVVVKEHEGCCPENLTISNTTLTGNEIFGATNTITVGPNVITEPGAQIDLIAGNSITFLPGSDIGPNVNAMIGECPGAFQNASSTLQNYIVTPDGDGINDEVCIAISGSPTYNVQVTNILGQVIFNGGGNVSAQPLCVWNGTCNFGTLCNNESVAAGYYFLTLTIIGCDGLPVIQTYDILVSYPGGRICLINEGIVDSTENGSLIIFPNPATNSVHINNISANSQIKILDVKGQIISEFISEKQDIDIDLKNISAGIYFVEVNDGQKKAVRKLVVY